jgi:1,4-dihydroxy-6-naphthoate synthase
LTLAIIGKKNTITNSFRRDRCKKYFRQWGSTEHDKLIKQSVEYAFKNNYKQLSDYVKMHAQEMSEHVMQQHIDLYVNNFSIELGNDGKKAVEKLLDVYHQVNF